MTYRACDLVVSNCTFWSLLESKFFLLSSPRQKHNFFSVVFKPAGFFFCWLSLSSCLPIYSALFLFIIFHFFDSNCNWLHLTACYHALHRRCLAIFNYSCGAVSVCIIQPSFWSQRVYKWKVNSAKGRVAHLPCLLETYWVFCNIKPLPLPCILSTLLASAIVWCSSRRACWNRNLRLREASLGTLTRPFSFFSWLFYCIKNFCNPTMKENRTALWAC